MRPVILLGLSALAICLFPTTGVRADLIFGIDIESPTGVHPFNAPEGAQAFADIGTPTANGSPNGDISTATKFTIGNLMSTTAQQGFFVGMGTQIFGDVPLDITHPTSISFGNSVFGTFTSTKISEPTNIPGAISLFADGLWTPGTFGGLQGQGPFEAQFTIAFTQTPPVTGPISDSSTFTTPIPGAPIPEPSSLLMGLTGLAAGVVISRLRRRWRSLARA
jgi:hypothetical protein